MVLGVAPAVFAALLFVPLLFVPLLLVSVVFVAVVFGPLLFEAPAFLALLLFVDDAADGSTVFDADRFADAGRRLA